MIQVRSGVFYECGLVFEGFNDLRFDQVEAYIMISAEIEMKLS